MKAKKIIISLLAVLTVSFISGIVPLENNPFGAETAEAASAHYSEWVTINGIGCPIGFKSGTTSWGAPYRMYLQNYYHQNGKTYAYYSGYYYY
ncbi:hypothetical protein I6N96_10830 [Enterococcus sp. BWM-S5]|uniref:Bacteriocin n=1 Tax=Enterococcus larvae TaxID=2794352 RepID=A0ABS4CJW5_9ENTE|nr:hypothetical protein [Enterococcus larvae]MBP1046760.1 hypothetical protein [Enterococcus larvae]